jgi:hypothetical protein
MNSMAEDTDEEKSFRGRYAEELKKKKQDGMADELDDERIGQGDEPAVYCRKRK